MMMKFEIQMFDGLLLSEESTWRSRLKIFLIFLGKVEGLSV